MQITFRLVTIDSISYSSVMHMILVYDTISTMHSTMYTYNTTMVSLIINCSDTSTFLHAQRMHDTTTYAFFFLEMRATLQPLHQQMHTNIFFLQHTSISLNYYNHGSDKVETNSNQRKMMIIRPLNSCNPINTPPPSSNPGRRSSEQPSADDCIQKPYPR